MIRLLACALLAGAALGAPPGPPRLSRRKVDQEVIDALYLGRDTLIEVQKLINPQWPLIKPKYDDLVAEYQRYEAALKGAPDPAKLDAQNAIAFVLDKMDEYMWKLNKLPSLTDFIKQVSAKIADLQYQMATEEGLMKRSDGSQQEALDNRVLALLEELVSE